MKIVFLCNSSIVCVSKLSPLVSLFAVSLASLCLLKPELIPPNNNLINHYFRAHRPQSYSSCFSAASVLQTFPLSNLLNSGPLYANKVIWGMFRAISGELRGRSGSSCLCEKHQDWDVWGKDTAEQTYVGFYKSDKKTVYACLLFTPEYTHSFIHLALDV